jgi:SAM-dependent methyltransferase
MSMTLAELWEICTKFMWDEQYVLGLDAFLRSHNVKTVLDCAGGTGFPCIELSKRLWDVTYSDGSAEMFAFFEAKIATEQLRIPRYRINWSELSTTIDKRFDAVLCRGNSLVYVNSWGQNGISSGAIEKVRQSLREFYNVLNDGGLLYVDLINRREFDRLSYPEVTMFGQKPICGRKISLTWELTHDTRSRKRIWKSTLFMDGEPHVFTYESCLLRQNELVRMMRDVGFENVQEVKISGEKNYDVFVGFKRRR